MALFNKKETAVSTEVLDAEGLARVMAENVELKAELKKANLATEKSALIEAHRESLTLSAEDVDKLSKESTEDIKGDLLNKAVSQLNAMKQSFEDTGSTSVGVASENLDVDTDEPKTFAEAINIIAKRENINKKEASELAKIEFSELFNKIYE